jgi:hypothetical protein
VKQVGVKIKERLALSLMMIYLAFSLCNLFFLPKYNKHQTGQQNLINGAICLQSVWLYNGANNLAILFHRTSKTIIENRQNLALFFKAAANVFLLMQLSSVCLLAIAKSVGYTGLLFSNRRRDAYLNFCSLRI